MDGVPAPFDLLGSIPSLLDENNSSEAVIQVPEVHGGDAALKVPLRRPQGSRKGDARSLLKTPLQVALLGTYRSLYWSKALLASISSFLRRAEGIAPSSMGGSYLLLHGDLMEEDDRCLKSVPVPVQAVGRTGW